jgi:hypothetical protein
MRRTFITGSGSAPPDVHVERFFVALCPQIAGDFAHGRGGFPPRIVQNFKFGLDIVGIVRILKSNRRSFGDNPKTAGKALSGAAWQPRRS